MHANNYRTSSAPLFGRIAALSLLLFITGCATHQFVDANATAARHAQQVDESLLVDVGITVFSPGLPPTEKEMEKSGITPDVRRAEANYVSYQLKDTLEQTGNWGAVRVTPRDSLAVELTVTGEIVESNGEEFSAKVKAVDATGRTWIDKTYSDTASKLSYRNKLKEDPFQDFYNNVSNDLLAAREKLSSRDIAQLRQVSAIKFARSMSPDAFASYIEEKRDGKIVITQLPSPNDPMFARIEKVKEREHLFVDAMDDHYANFHREMQPAYHDWREYSYDEAVALKEIRSEATMRGIAAAALIVGGVVAGSKSDSYAGQAAALGAAAGGVALAKTAIDKYRESEIHRDSLKELGQSLGAEVTPIVLDIEGKTIEMTGTLDTQYDKWRRILKQIYEEETGTGVDPRS